MTELEQKLINALTMIRNHINEPEVIAGIIDMCIGSEDDYDLLFDDPEVVAGTDTGTDTDTDTDTDKDSLQDDPVREAADKIKGTIKSVVSNAKRLTPDGVPEDDDTFGEEQANGLAEIFKGLKDGPSDNRW